MNKKSIAGLIAIIVAIASVAIFAGCVEKDEVMPSMPTPSEPSITEDLSGRNILMVIAPKDFRDEELFEPKEIFEEKGAEVTIASTTTEIVKGMLGGTVKPDLKISDVNVEDYDAIVIVGGAGSKEYLWDDEELRAMVKEAYNKDKVLAAICLSPVVLAKAGILDGKKATVFPDKEAISELKNGGAIYLDEEVVVSDRVITGKGPESAEELSLVILGILGIFETATSEAKKDELLSGELPKPIVHSSPIQLANHKTVIVRNEGAPGIVKVVCQYKNGDKIHYNKRYIFLDRGEEKGVSFVSGYTYPVYSYEYDPALGMRVHRITGWEAVGGAGKITASPVEVIRVKGKAKQDYIPGLTNISSAKVTIMWGGPVTHYTLYVTGIDGSNKEKIISGDEKEIDLISWNKEGICFEQENEIWFIDSAGKNRKQLTSFGYTHCRQAQLSPDGKKLAVALEEAVFNSIWVMNSDGSNKKYLTAGNYPTWSPDGEKISFFNGEQLCVINSDGRNERALVERATMFRRETSWSPDGKKLVWDRSFSLRTGNVWIVDTESGEIKMLAEGESPSWSPTSNKIAFVQGGNIGLMDSDGNNVVLLTANRDVESFKWSPDGDKIAFYTKEKGLWVMDKDGSHKMQIEEGITTLPSTLRPSFCWSPDSKKLAFVSRSSVSVPTFKGVKGNILFFDEDERIIAFEDIAVDVTVNLYEGVWSETMEEGKKTSHLEKGKLLWSDTVEIDSWGDATSLIGEGLRIPIEDVEKLKDAKFAEVIVHTSKGDFKDECRL